jgi:SAM-dependent methyltransferase
MRLVTEANPLSSRPTKPEATNKPLGLNRFLRKLRRRVYRMRLYIPGLRERHILETMIGPVGAWEQLQAFQLRVLKTNGLKPHHRLIDIGCGPLQGGIAFIQYLETGKYVGVDRSSRNLSAAYRLIGKHGLCDKNPLLILSETFGQEELPDVKFDFFWASQILYYFNDAMLKQLFKFVVSRMTPAGKFFGDIIGNNHPDRRNPEQIDGRRALYMHSPESMARCAESAGLRIRSLGEIVNYGYPKRFNLRTNLLIEATPSFNLQP